MTHTKFASPRGIDPITPSTSPTSSIPFLKTLSTALELLFLLNFLWSLKYRGRRPKRAFLHLTTHGFLLTVLVLVLKFLVLVFDVSAITRPVSNTFSDTFTRLLPITLVLETIITLVFWLLFLIDQRLIMTGPPDRRPWYQHLHREMMMHWGPFIILLLEAIQENFPILDRLSMLLLIGFILLYWLACEIYTKRTGEHLYGVLSRIPLIFRPFVFVFVVCVGIVMYGLISGK